MMRRVLVTILLSALAQPLAAEQPRRQLDAHAHGEGRLAIAIEGGRVEMELEAPASDILGFEHAPKTAAQRKALADAKRRLQTLAGLLVLPAAAGCKLATAKVEVIGAAAGGKAHAHDHGHDHGKDKKAETASSHDAHSEFKATYALACGATDKLGSIAFDYFKTFPRATKLDVTVIGPKGQSSFAVTRQKPTLDLSGLS